MSRRTLAVAAALLLGAGYLVWMRLGPLPVPRNVLLITIDTLRADRLGCYGSTRGLTPNLDALAADGACFSRAYTPVPLTGPSHATMLTGLYPRAHGLMNNGTQVLSQDQILVSEVLQERGFQTAAIVSALVLSSSFGLNQGWNLYYEENITGSEGQHGLWYDQRAGDKTVDRALTWLKAEADRPFFLWVHLFDPHDPYDPPSPFKERYPQAPYDGEVAFADAQAGRLIETLRSMGLYNDTLIVVAGDHGEGLGEHGEKFHAIFLYNTTTQVPLIVRAPGGRRGVRVTDLASTMDITPTILDSLRIEAPAPRKGAAVIQGVSLLEAAARGGRVPARSIFLETIYPSASYGWSAVRAIVNPEWKMIDLPEAELYDLAGDPGEQQNLHATLPARVSEIKADYDHLFAEVQSAASEAEAASIDDETRDRLISLGYIGGQQSVSTSRVGPDPKRMAFMTAPITIAMEFMHKTLWNDAIVMYTKVLEVDPDNRIALLQMARAQAASGHLEASVPYFEHAINVYPDVEEFYRTYGMTYLRAGRIEQAQGVFKTALAALPESSHMHFLLGYARMVGKDYKGAEEELELTVRLGRKLSRPWYLLAICRLLRGDETGALSALEEYLRLEPNADRILRDPAFAPMLAQPAFQELIKKYL